MEQHSGHKTSTSKISKACDILKSKKRHDGGDVTELAFPPRLNKHNDVIYGEVLGYSSDQLAELRNRGLI